MGFTGVQHPDKGIDGVCLMKLFGVWFVWAIILHLTLKLFYTVPYTSRIFKDLCLKS